VRQAGAARLAADEEALRAAIGPKPAILINSPHNPAGRVFSREELEVLAKVVSGTDIVVICDEVYEHLVFDGAVHIPSPLCRDAGTHPAYRFGGKISRSPAGRWLGDGAARTGQCGDQGAPILTFTTSPALQTGVLMA